MNVVIGVGVDISYTKQQLYLLYTPIHYRQRQRSIASIILVICIDAFCGEQYLNFGLCFDSFHIMTHLWENITM
jgi:hypothetical protein